MKLLGQLNSLLTITSLANYFKIRLGLEELSGPLSNNRLSRIA